MSLRYKCSKDIKNIILQFQYRLEWLIHQLGKYELDHYNRIYNTESVDIFMLYIFSHNSRFLNTCENMYNLKITIGEKANYT